ncbi:hypothetical protein ABAC402_17770 [Asticcacaulis sp. AC402]|nr:hypothetical protein ABAC402_17770 [Asticcacaulis sp. AC402]
MLFYFAMAFGISWSGILVIVETTGFTIAAPTPLATGLFFVAMLLGPSIGGLAIIRLVDGRAGLLELRARLFNWQLGAGWYAVALLAAPICLVTVLLLFSFFVSPTFFPKFQWPLLVVGLIAGSFEEIGWTGFATPRLLARHGIGRSGLQLGLVWALWHLLVVYLFTLGAMGEAWIWSFAIVYLATLTPYRILMTWVYAHTRSVMLAVLMHASYTGWLLVVFPATSSSQSLAWQAGFAATLWIVAGLALRKSATAELYEKATNR